MHRLSKEATPLEMQTFSSNTNSAGEFLYAAVIKRRTVYRDQKVCAVQVCLNIMLSSSYPCLHVLILSLQHKNRKCQMSSRQFISLHFRLVVVQTRQVRSTLWLLHTLIWWRLCKSSARSALAWLIMLTPSRVHLVVLLRLLWKQTEGKTSAWPTSEQCSGLVGTSRAASSDVWFCTADETQWTRLRKHWQVRRDCTQSITAPPEENFWQFTTDKLGRVAFFHLCYTDVIFLY